MRILSFSAVINDCAQPHRLQKCKLVIDGKNFCYNLYDKSGLPRLYGTECDKYADYLKKYLTDHLINNDIKCYFIFKGGTKNLEKKLCYDEIYRATPDNNHPNFVNDINMQVLDEMNIKYVITEYEAKVDCVALAKKMSCPILSFNAEFAFAGIQYIPYPTFDYNKEQNCKIFSLENLLKKFSIKKDKLPFFILLTDIKVFPEHTFGNLYKSLKIPEKPQKFKLTQLLKWLSKTDSSTIMSNIINHAKESNVSQEEIYEALNNVTETIEPEVTGPLSIDYLIDSTTDATADSWFQKGVALNFIASQYIDMYRSNKLLMYSAAPENVQTSLKIVKYAYDLLTNFRNDELKVLLNHRNPNHQVLLVKDSVEKPIYEANECVFENGWNGILSLRLFQHFMIKDNNFQFDKLDQVPSEAQLLFITLVYLYRKQSDDIVLSKSILLSYVTLGIVRVVIKGGYKEAGCHQTQATFADCQAAEKVLKKYFTFTEEVNEGLRCSMIEFQHCLEQFNYLNRLCGSPFKPTVYSRSFNATFVYNILRTVVDETIFFNTLLEQAPSVLSIFNRLIRLYKELL